MNRNNYCVIMAGGIGSRFWPISRANKPKQFLDILDTGKTFIQSTYDRFSEFIAPENFLVVTNSNYKPMVLEQLPMLKEDQVLCEPLGRNTAPCITYAAFRLKAMNPNATMIVTPSDHLILDDEEFSKVINEAADFASNEDVLVTIGLKPTRPATGYGYIQAEQPINENGMNKVKTFTEKPNLEMAEIFMNSGEFFWNSGIFVWKADSILGQVQKFIPETYNLFASIAQHYATPGEQKQIDRIYPECRSVSIDYAIMEKADNTHVRCADFGWSDIGTWDSLYQYARKDENNNTAESNTITFDTTDCVLKIPEGKIAVIEGLEKYIVVDTDNVLMICPREHEQDIKRFIDTVKFSKGEEFI